MASWYSGDAMTTKLYTGIDYHKKFSVACTMDEQGNLVREGRIAGNTPEGFEAYFKGLPAPSEVVIEACWNWGVLYDLLEQTPGVIAVVLSHPAKNRIIADAQIKNDRVDARALATLLRGNFVARVHVPAKEVRLKKNTLRQRLWLARMRTRMRNRIHSVIDRYPRLPRPAVKDIFSKKGLAWLKRTELPASERTLLDEDLELHTTVEAQIKALEKQIQADNAANPTATRLLTLPGVGVILAPVIAMEIDTIGRFNSPEKLCAYAGLVPTTHGSAGKVSHGSMLPFSNRWLKWAFIEAAWVAINFSDYFGAFYRTQRQRGKKPNVAICITARRMAIIAWKMLTQERDYTEAPPRPGTLKTLSPAALTKA
jgi:transposase